MHRLVAIEVDRPGKHRIGFVLVDLLGEKQCVGAQDHVLLAIEEAAHDLRHIVVQQRFPTGDRDHRRAALVDGLHALIEAQTLVENLVRVVDLAASSAREIATEERLQHQHERIALGATEMLFRNIGADSRHGFNGKTHAALLLNN
jgi:hypothetical protein